MAVAPETSEPRLELPHRFGDGYVLFDRIGVGGMAEIYLARRTTRVGASGLAVVKLVRPELSNDPRFASMLTAEAKLAARLSHGSVVQTYDLGRENGQLYIAMEYVEGFDLNELLRHCSRARIPLPAEFALFIAGETLRALDYAHRARDPEGRPLGVVHRDVSPSNVLISFEGEVKLCDFGIARAADTRDDLGSEAIEGKASYMSPEQARGEALDARADVFAASIVLWEMLAGRRMYKPVAGGPDALTLARDADIPALPDRGLPDHARMADLVARGLAVDREARFATAMAMARELDAYMMATGLRASPLRLGAFVMDHFGAEIVETRRAHEYAAAALDADTDVGLRPPADETDRVTTPSPMDAPVEPVPSATGSPVPAPVANPAPVPSIPPLSVPARPPVAKAAASLAPSPVSPRKLPHAVLLLLLVLGLIVTAVAFGTLLGHR